MNSVPLSSAASLYGISESELQPLRGGNFAHVYGFRRNDRDFILRLAPPNKDVDLAAQRSILAWMEFLALHGAFVPAPLPSQHGNLVEVIPSSQGEWLVVASRRAAGILSEELSLDQWNGSMFQLLGRSIGRMHALARGYIPPKGMSYPQWESGGNMFNHLLMDEVWLKDKQSHLLTRILELPKPEAAYGLIHCDLHFGNFFVDIPGQIITLIDFDDCAYGWFVMDIAVLLFDILVLYPGADRDVYGLNFLRNFLIGYLAENPQDKFWIEQIPLFLKLLEINLYDMVAKYYPNDSGEWSMRFMPGRKERLENDTPYMELDHSTIEQMFFSSDENP
jgi:Ser/Thr protein kinase RdoA (MazF antagonist)